MNGIVAALRVTCVALFLAGSAGSGLAGPQISAVRTTGKCIALTFDDGPHASLTPKLLGILRARGAKATFFVVGSRVKAWPGVVGRASRDGHEIGNHSWSHPALPGLGSQAVRKQLSSTDAVVVRATGKTPKVLRAPYGSISSRVAGLDRRPFIGWSVDPLDWRYKGSERIVKRVLSGARSGAIVLMHDTKARTIAAVPAIVSGLKQRGYRLVTVSELLGGGCGRPGTQAPGGVRADRAPSAPGSGKAAGTTARTPTPGPDLGPEVTRTSPSGGSYSYQEGSRVGTYTINGRTFTYERD